MKRDIAKIAIILLVVFGAIGGFDFWMHHPFYGRAPRDATLITNFQKHRAVFKKVRVMMDKDSLRYISASSASGHLSEARLQQYRELLSELSPKLTVTQSTGDVTFIFAGSGMSTVGPEWFKGIEYLPNNTLPGGKRRKSLDDITAPPAGDAYLRQIAPKWFLYVSH